MRVSIALATHDGMPYLAEQLATIARQTVQPAELVVYDDASSDDTPGELGRFAASVPFPVRITCGADRIGSTRAFERAIGACGGDLIALCDQDDLWHADKLERAAAAFGRWPEVGLVFGDATVIDGEGRRLAGSLWRVLGARPPERGRDATFFIDSLSHPTVPGCTAVFRAGCLDHALPFPSDVGVNEHVMQHDAWLIAIVSATSEIEALHGPVIAYRVHARQQIGLRGAPPRTRVARIASRAGRVMARQAQLRAELELREGGAAAVSERLASVDGDAHTRACSGLAADLAEHLRVRISLPRRRHARLALVRGEWLTMRYRRYSSGALSALSDLLRW